MLNVEGRILKFYLEMPKMRRACYCLLPAYCDDSLEGSINIERVTKIPFDTDMLELRCLYLPQVPFGDKRNVQISTRKTARCHPQFPTASQASWHPIPLRKMPGIACTSPMHVISVCMSNRFDRPVSDTRKGRMVSTQHTKPRYHPLSFQHSRYCGWIS